MTSHNRSSRMPLHRRIAAAGAVTAATLLLAACGSDTSGAGHEGHNSAATQESTKSPAAGAFNDADVTFAQSMIVHHQQALEMSKLADGRASDQEIKTLAGQIEKAQDPEIKTMQSWLKAWGKPESSGMDHGGMNHGSGSMPGMMSEKDMADLTAAKGTGFDRKFAELMIAHHNGAIDMAKDEQKNGRDAAAKKLADDVIKNQSTEVKQMQGILDRL
ncbi:DUF305 domain-containing protein [Streptomyces lunaelactis]|uniref:DUF305 domain-containing protein n=1 Tax=Streptomyces lunaelactis TaxID=1535768 RepID=UPI001584DF57|nr:DUF305 domain-containing protein [Streptomyces lunaelactis]NUK04473.1 DUF305 domain-containing protein [Streptomyces lunaelactis]NUK07364.1 DUF305 domain-containing protein [Streptomyces lunaelactis]NUK15745.1 DUF305 domain-containing protein [Streptomyces lunaelactis]NUK33751.1 DUF305 domain-containing protein [Streptomyces lunaelactis]NUK44394.1 DUF305 domain-containing protein [Streptomyces lunaelactis]